MFFIKTTTGTDAGRFRKIKSIIGELPITEKQATKLNVKTHQRISPVLMQSLMGETPKTALHRFLEQCCLRASANVSYENAARDIEYYTGMKISAKTQQRIIHRYEFPTREFSEKISEVSVDGGKVRLRTEEKGQPCIWKDYKAVCVDKLARKAWFSENEELVNWVNEQPLSDPLNCLGDGHPDIWKLVKQFESPGEKREILDWFHLVENLHKVGGSLKRLEKAESLLWEDKID